MLIAGIVALVMAIEEQPIVARQVGQLDEADKVQPLLRQLRQTLRNRYSRQSVDLSVDQLNSLIGMVQRAVPEFAGNVTVQPARSILSASYRLPQNPLGDFLNVQVSLLPAPGMQVEEVRFGSLALPGDWVVASLVTLADWWTQSDIASLSLQQVHQVAMQDNRIKVTLNPLDAYLKQLNQVQNGLSVAQNEPLRRRTAHYLNVLWQLPYTHTHAVFPLERYMQPLFEEARLRSAQNPAEKENEAAILALAVFSGHHRLANFIGDVQPVDGDVALPRYRPVIQGRTDLTQHFVLSAAIKILSEQGVSNAIGEFKELMDRAQGGSGYSFVDLAADMAGVEFAEVATDPRYARRFQEVFLQQPTQASFFPDITGLPEGLSKQDFERRYQRVDSAAYQLQVEDIARKVAALHLFQWTTPRA